MPFSSANLCIGQGTHVGSGNKVTFSLDHKRGLAVFTGGMTYATFTGNIPFKNGSAKYFLMKPSTSTSFTDNIKGTYSLSAAIGRYTTCASDLNPIDLSMVDCAGNANASGRTTANCYMVHQAGPYKLPLVYGNAIKNGARNQIAYKPGTVTNGCSNFINHAGTAISAPWITKSGSGVNGGMGITVDGAQLIWQDVNGLVTDIAVDGDYLTFTVPDFAEGNAVIAAKSGSTIVWSWHIWVTAETYSNLTTVATGSHNYSVTPVNLGWVPTGGGGKQGYCPFYQWGRKDPFVPSNGSGNTDKTVYVGSDVNSKGWAYEGSTTSTIGTTIQYPWKHYYNSSTRGAVTTTYYNMWDAKNNTTGNITSATKKTIYDPCPPGFCIPTGNLWYYFGNGGNRKMSTWDGTNKGATWNTGITGDALWFPASGVRYYSRGSIDLVGGIGYYWSASPNSSNGGSRFSFFSSGWYWDYSYLAYGFPVRPVAEE